jgi:zinc transport system permease protein
MVVPVAAAQQLTRGFKATVLVAMVFGVLSGVGGLYAGYQRDLSPGPAIVLIALVLFVLAVAARRLGRGGRSAKTLATRAARATRGAKMWTAGERAGRGSSTGSAAPIDSDAEVAS